MLPLSPVNETRSHTDFVKFEDVGLGAELTQELLRGFAVWAPGLAENSYL
jgi:hypothetical protein